LANALKHDDNYNDETLYEPEDLSRKIEEHIFNEFKDTNMKYKNRIRSRISNLNDKKNPDLKLNVLRGSIKTEKIAVMTAEVWL
jgi:transcription elongation factor S-II